jgi:hypothetical protein
MNFALRSIFVHTTKFGFPLWSSSYRACYWTQGSRVQTRTKSIDFKGD